MNLAISALQGALPSLSSSASGGSPPAAGARAAVDPKTHKMAQEFEAMFVRQILKSAKIGGHEKEDGFDGMAVDALATGITEGGGLGLARQIEESLRTSSHMAPVPSKPEPRGGT